MYPEAKGFYLGKIGNEDMDTSLLGLHYEQVYLEDEDVIETIISFDLLYLALVRSTWVSFIELFKDKEDKNVHKEDEE